MNLLCKSTNFDFRPFPDPPCIDAALSQSFEILLSASELREPSGNKKNLAVHGFRPLLVVSLFQNAAAPKKSSCFLVDNQRVI